MGNGPSAHNINAQNDLIQQIHGVARDLTETYTTKFLNPKFCTNVALIYNNKLMNFSKQELNGVSLTLGLVADVPHKADICNAIVKHYTDRLNLVAAIQESLNYCSNRVFALSGGPRCVSDPEIFDQEVCTRNGGRWADVIAPPDEKVPENKVWYNYLFRLQEDYLKALARLLEILTRLRDYSEDINDEVLREMGVETQNLFRLMQESCGNIYKLALTTPTFTTDEVRAAENNKQIAAGDSAARTAALRAAHGLEAVGAQ